MVHSCKQAIASKCTRSAQNPSTKFCRLTSMGYDVVLLYVQQVADGNVPAQTYCLWTATKMRGQYPPPPTPHHKLVNRKHEMSP